MDDNDLAKNPPTTVKEIGIHLVYISRALSDLQKAVHELPNGFASVKDVSDLETRVAKMEARNNVKTTLLWVGLVASAIINIVVVYELFGGK